MEANGQLHALAALPAGKACSALTQFQAGWSPWSVWTLWRRVNSLAHDGNQSTAPQSSRPWHSHSTKLSMFPTWKSNYSKYVWNSVWILVMKCCEVPYFSDHKMHRTIRRTMIFLLDILEKNNDECTLILVIYWKKTGLVHTKISNHNLIYSS